MIAIQSSKATRPKKVLIGDLLIEHGVITKDQLDAALTSQKKSGRKLGRELIEKGFITEEQLTNLLSRQLNLPYIDLNQFKLNADVVRLIPETYSRRYRVVALEDTQYGLTIGMVDPTDIFAYDEVVRLINRPLFLTVVKESELRQTIERFYRRSAEMSGLAAELGSGLSDTYQDQSISHAAIGEGAETPVAKFLHTMLEDAVQINASDIHIEPDETELRIRLRQDGVLHVQTVAERRIASQLISRLKLMADLDISEKRLPQDGRFNIKIGDKNIDIRLSTIPVQHGESAVMRLLNQSSSVLSLDRLGMPDKLLEHFRRLIHSPHGMVLVTGPTGSGKTTTLYSALAEISTPEIKILTAEDPIEYRLPGINQVQVNPKIDLSFARLLRTFLRQDPDVILVGEMRDEETMGIGLRAAITGHLVMSSLHTNDAIATAMRLLDMGAEPYLMAAALRGVLAQRLVRKICRSCAKPYQLNTREKALVDAALGATFLGANFKKGRGCNQCGHSGYFGRTAVYELLEIDSELVSLLQRGGMREFSSAARSKESYQTLRTSAMSLAATGQTTIDEVLRISYGITG